MDTILKQLSARGFRLTRVRKEMVALFSELKKPVSADQLKKILRKKGFDVNKTTVYRELAFLREQKIISEIDLLEGKKRYESALLGHHHHLICGKCKAIKEIGANDLIENEIARISRKHAYKNVNHFFEIIGLCPKCS